MLPAKSCQRKKSSEGGLRSVQSDEWIPDGPSHRVVQFCTGDHWKKDTGWNTGEDSPYKLRILFWSQNPLGNFGESLWIAHFACHIPACQMEVPKSTWGDFLAPTNPRASSKNCIFLLNCISKTGIASGIFAERSLYEVSGFPINLWRTLISYGVWTLISSTSFDSNRWMTWALQSLISRPEVKSVSFPGLTFESVLWVIITGILIMIPSWFFESETVAVSFGLASNGAFQSLLLNGHQEGDSSSVNNLVERRES